MTQEASKPFVLDEATVRHFYSRFLACADFAAFAAENYVNDVVWDNFLPANVPFGGSWRGRDAVVDYLNGMMSVIAIKSFDIDKVLIAGNAAVIFGREESDVVNTGRSYQMDWVHELEFDPAGRIIRAREYNDTAAMQAAFG